MELAETRVLLRCWLKTEVHPYSTELLRLTWLAQSGHSFIFYHKLADLFLDSKTVE